MTTTKLSDTQRAVLTAAGASPDRLIRPDHIALKGGAVGIVLTSLINRGLVEEIAAGEDDHAWWKSEDDKPLALKVTNAGCQAVGIAAAPEPQVGVPATTSRPFRSGTKQAMLTALLQRPGGATLEEMVAATGWQSHTVRGAMAGALKKRLGLEITAEKVEGRGRVYQA